jgi:hypothetical protein
MPFSEEQLKRLQLAKELAAKMSPEERHALVQKWIARQRNEAGPRPPRREP